jgi:hypothetical protein
MEGRWLRWGPPSQGVNKMMKSIFVAFVITCIAQSVSAAQEPISAETLLEHMPCQAWTIMHDNDWSGQRRDQIEVERWTVRYLREYARRATERSKKDQPERDWKNADGADVDDRRILGWIMAYCMKNPGEPLIKAAFFLWSSFWIAPDHRQLPPP